MRVGRRVSSRPQSLPLLAQSATEFEALAREYAALGDRQAAASAEDGLGLALTEKESALAETGGFPARPGCAVVPKRPRGRSRTSCRGTGPRRKIISGVRSIRRGSEPVETKPLSCSSRRCRPIAVPSKFSPKPICPRTGPDSKQSRMRARRRGRACKRRKAIALLDRRCRRIAARSRSSPKPICPTTGQHCKTISEMRSRTRGSRHGNQAASLLDQAVQAFRNALEFRTKADLPQDWAVTQNNLGLALWEEGLHASGDRATALFDQAAQAFRRVLEVDTQADRPRTGPGRKTISPLRSMGRAGAPVDPRPLPCSIKQCRRIAARSRSTREHLPRVGPERKTISEVRWWTRESAP